MSYSDIKCLARGSRHQGDFVGGGAQCVFAALVFLCRETSGHLSTRNSATIDQIVEDGTQLYLVNHSASSMYTMINELPDTVILNSLTYKVRKLSPIFSGLTNTDVSDSSALTFSIKDAVREAFECTTTCFLTLGPAACAYTSAICKSRDGFVCFDSHSRTPEGISCEMNGKSVLLKVSSESSLVWYIIELSKSLFSCAQVTQFELSPVSIDFSTDPVGSEAHISSLDNECEMFMENAESSSVKDCHGEMSTQSQPMTSECIIDHKDDDIFPTVCQLSQFKNWKVNRSWLIAKRLNKTENITGVTCKTCTEIGSLSNCLSTEERISVSVEWLNGVTAKNSKKLHDKLRQHEQSKAHLSCIQEVKDRASQVLNNLFINLILSGNLKMPPRLRAHHEYFVQRT